MVVCACMHVAVILHIQNMGCCSVGGRKKPFLVLKQFLKCFYLVCTRNGSFNVQNATQKGKQCNVLLNFIQLSSYDKRSDFTQSLHQHVERQTCSLYF